MTPNQRMTDNSIWWKSSELTRKYKMVVWLIFAFLIMLGFNFQTPAMAIKEVKSTIDIDANRITRLENLNTSINRKLDAIILIQCYSISSNNHDLQIAGLNCNKDK